MCYVIVTSGSLSWILVTLVATMCVLSALLTPKWLVAPGRPVRGDNATIHYSPSVGIYNRCTVIDGRSHCGPFSLEGFYTDDLVFPGVWKAALFFIALGLTMMCVTVIFGLISSCFQAICRKSIFSISGTIQACAGISFIIGMLLYPFGWGAPRVQRLCGQDAAPFFPSDCTFGWALYCGIVGVVLTFLCCFLSVLAEKTTSSDRVQRNIRKGKTLICLL